MGTTALNLQVGGFAACNVALTIVWLVLAFRILKLHQALTMTARAAAVVVVTVVIMSITTIPVHAQETTREEQIATAQAGKAQHLHPYVPTSWETPVRAYFRRDGGAWRLVGFERSPAD